MRPFVLPAVPRSAAIVLLLGACLVPLPVVLVDVVGLPNVGSTFVSIPALFSHVDHSGSRRRNLDKLFPPSNMVGA